MRHVRIALMITGLAFGTTACPEKGPMQKADEKVDEGIEDAKEAVTPDE